jgi:hypothetical protein
MSDIENEVEVEEVIDNLDDDIANAIKELSTDTTEKETESTDQSEVTEEKPAEPEIEAPQAWDATAKEKFKTLPKDVQEFIRNREDEIHKGFTKQDEERTFGKKIKDVVTPYMAVIQAEGGTPETAVRDLLNTAYSLRTGTPQQKAELVRSICQQYGVPLEYLGQQQQQTYVDPSIAAMQQQLEQLRQQANPDVIKKQLQEQFENDKVLSEVNAFASNPANEYYETVKPIMASLLTSGAASDLKEAYEMACKAHPQIGSAIEAKRMAEVETKKKAELAAKKKASVSVSSSSSNAVANAKTQKSNDDLEDDIRSAMAELGHNI